MKNDFEDEIESSIDYVANVVREQYLEVFEKDLKDATAKINSLQQQLEEIASDDLKFRQIESLKSGCEGLEALVKAMIDKDRRVLKKIDITKTHLNTESK